MFSHLTLLFSNLPLALETFLHAYGAGLYFVLFLVIFAETGLVVAPLLPGDSLLFGAGALVGMHSDLLSFWHLAGLLVVAAVLGDGVNYLLGRTAGKKLMRSPRFSRWIQPEHWRKTEAFFARHGGKAVVMGRFMPIVRTYVPFVAGMGAMSRGRFTAFNVVGALLWVVPLLFLGQQFGALPSVQRNFHWVVLAIIAISFLPLVLELTKKEKISNPNSHP